MLSGTEAGPCAAGGQPGWCGATQGAQQKCFGLIILMMREQQRFICRHRQRQRVITRLPRGRFNAGLHRHLYAQHIAGHACRCRLLQGLRGPSIGIRVQAVVHMQGTQTIAQRRRDLRGGEQERQGVGAAAEGDDNASDRRRILPTRLQKMLQGAERMLAIRAGDQAMGCVLP